MDIKKVVVGEWGVNCYLILDDGYLAVVDPGDEAEKIISEIEKLAKVKPKYILLTHGHFDHIMAIKEIKEKYGFKLICGEGDKNFSKINQEIGINVPDIEVDITVKEGDTLEFGRESIMIFETSGHTEGSVSYLIGDNLFSGDTLFRHNHGRTDLPGGNDEDMKNSLSRILKLDEGIKVHPGHGPETTIKEERGYYAN